MPDRYQVATIDVENEGAQAVSSWLNQQAANGYELRASTPIPGRITGFTLLIVERPPERVA